jgi:hypothetical protein
VTSGDFIPLVEDWNDAANILTVSDELGVNLSGIGMALDNIYHTLNAIWGRMQP